MSTARVRFVRATGAMGSAAVATALALVLAAGAGSTASAAPAPPGPEGSTTTATPTPAPDDADAEPAVTLTLTDLAPAVARLTDTLVLTGTITNTTDEPFVNPTLRVGKQQSVPASRLALERWFDPVTGPSSRIMTSSPYEVTVAPGQTVPFSASVPVADLAFPVRPDNWGARGLEVTLTSGETRAVARTVGVFHPEEPVLEPALQIGALVPLTASASEWTSAIESDVPVEDVAGARLHELIDAAGTDVSWALDPALLDLDEETSAPDDATTDAAENPDGAGGSTDTGTLQEHLVAAAGGRDVLALPWADSDISALGGAGQDGTTLLTDARLASNEVFASLGLQVATTTAWPAAPGTSEQSVRIADRAGYTSLVLDGVATVDPELIATPSARVDVPVSGVTTSPAVVSDPHLSAAVAGEALEGTESQSPQLASRQYALALSAVITRESGAQRTVVVTADRSAVSELGTDGAQSVADFGDRISTLMDAPWITPVGIDDALAAVPDEAPRATLPLTLDVTTPTFSRAVTSALEGLTQVGELRSALERPEVLDGVVDVLGTTTASAWRLDGANPSIASEAGWDALARYSEAVTVSVPASLVDVFAEESAVPLTLTNTIDQTLTVDVRAVPDQPGLRVEEVPRLTIAPGQTVQVRVPMVAVANGQSSVTVDVLSPDGASVGPGETFNLRVRAEWETVGTGIVVAGLAVLLVIGLIRTFRRGRRGSDGIVPGTQPPDGVGDGDPDDDDGPESDPDPDSDLEPGPDHEPHTDTTPAPPTTEATR